MTYNEIITAFDNHLKKSSKVNWRDYYVGITDNVDERLHDFHKIPKNGHWFIWCPADSEEIARDVEKHYLGIGMEGGTGGGNSDTIYVYCYEINPSTRER